MKYEDFVCFVQTEVEGMLGEEVRVQRHQVIKNNSIKLDGLSIMDRSQNISPTIYLNDYYKEFKKGTTIPEISEDILRIYQCSKLNIPIDTGFYLYYENVKNKVACKLINYSKNKELLELVPHLRYLDLAVVFYYFMKNDIIGTGTILIYNNHLKMWNITKEELYDTARRNTPCILPYDFRGMEEIMRDIADYETAENFKDIIRNDQSMVPMYVLSNSEKMMGAAYILYDSILAWIGERLHDDFYILPSSIHECIIVPERISTSKAELCCMVKEINDTQVRPEEILSDTVYFYDREVHRLSM